jgi:hypothetical protein
MENLDHTMSPQPEEENKVPEEFQAAVEKAKEAGSSLSDRLDTLGKTEFDEPKGE